MFKDDPGGLKLKHNRKGLLSAANMGPGGPRGLTCKCFDTGTWHTLCMLSWRVNWSLLRRRHEHQPLFDFGSTGAASEW